MRNKYKILIAAIIGFAIAMLVMAIDIYFGYVNAYQLNIGTYDVSLFGMNIYQLTLNGDVYEGQSIGPNMGIVSLIFIIIAGIIETLIIGAGTHKAEREQETDERVE